MNEHCGYVVRINRLRPHSNADRLQIADIFNNPVIVGLNVKIGDIGVYFPSNLQLSKRFCAANDLVRRKDENGKQIGGYLDPDKRNIKAIKLRGEMSDGLYLPITCLADFCKISDLKAGDTIDVVNGELICQKYVPRRNPRPTRDAASGKPKKPKANIAPTFYEHVDTAQLAYNLHVFKPGDIVQLTLKMHGTSGRTGLLPIRHTKRTWFDKLFHRHGKDYMEYGYITGTRRVVLDGKRKGGFYESDDFREAMAAKFEGKLRKGETVYYEIVGYLGHNGAPIMGEVSNKKVKDPEFEKQYGPTTVFSYGCSPSGGWTTDDQDSSENNPPCCDIYVYRMTMVNESGDVVEYSPAQIKERCEQMNVNVVPEFETFIIPQYEFVENENGACVQPMNAGEYVLRKVEQYFDGPDPIGKTHVREGVVARILNRPNFAVYKHKNFSFKVLSNIIVDQLTDEQIDSMSQDMLEEM